MVAEACSKTMLCTWLRIGGSILVLSGGGGRGTGAWVSFGVAIGDV